MLANSQFTAAGVETLELGTQRLKCRQKLPDREHHCVIVFTDATLDIADLSQLRAARTPATSTWSSTRTALVSRRGRRAAEQAADRRERARRKRRH